ncbi:hypothetical protein [Psychroflexus sp. MBR-150]|jgi:hypothetical protein
MSLNQTKQYRLFEEEANHKSINNDEKIKVPEMLNKLQISEEDTKKESKLKQLISSRLKKIEKQKSLLEEDRKLLNKIKALYHKNLPDDLNGLCKDIERFTEKLVKRYKQKSFSEHQRRLLEYLIEDNFDQLLFKKYTSETLDSLIDEYNEYKEKYYGFDEDDSIYEENDDDEFGDSFAKSIEKEMIKHMLENMGVDLEDEFFKDIDLNDPNFQDKFKARFFEYKEKQQETEKHEEKKQQVITTDKEFTKLYKTLVKKVHPDLTTDETERKRREELMKELSMVWKNRDLYQLLVLQSQIEPNNDTSIELNKSQLQQIADNLLEKTKELEQERFVYKKHPENEFYYKNFFGRSERKILLHIENFKKQLKKESKEINNNISKLKTQKTTKEFLKSVDEKLNEEDIFDAWF